MMIADASAVGKVTADATTGKGVDTLGGNTQKKRKKEKAANPTNIEWTAHTMNGANDSSSIGITKSFTNIKVCISYPITDTKFNPIESLVEIFPRMKAQDEKLEIAPLKSAAGTKSITNLGELPRDEESYKKHFEYVESSPRAGVGRRHNLFFTVKTLQQFYDIKNGMLQWMMQQRIYMPAHKWEMLKITAVGFLLNAHPGLSYRDDTVDEIAACIEEGRTPGDPTEIPTMELVSQPIGAQKNGGNRIVTRALELRCAEEDKETLQNFLMNAKYTNRRWKYIPHGFDRTSDQAKLKQIIRAQNAFISNCRSIAVCGFANDAMKLDIPGTTTTLWDQLMLVTEQKQPLFLAVSR